MPLAIILQSLRNSVMALQPQLLTAMEANETEKRMCQ
jgi:hypothetical protein